MNVTLQYGTNRFNLLVSPQMTVGKVKNNLSDVFNIDPENIYLWLTNKFLNDKHTISKYDIREGSTLIMTATITIYLLHLDTRVPVEIFSDATVANLREQVSETNGFKDFVLKFNGRDLEYEESLVYWGIKHESIVEIIDKMKVIVNYVDEDYEIELRSDETILELKEKVCGQIDKLVYEVNAYYDEQLMSDGKMIKDYHIRDNSRVLVKSSERTSHDIHIFVQNLHNHKPIKIVIPFDATVEQLKSVTKQKFGFTGTRQFRLIYAGKSLEDGKTLRQYDIDHQDEVMLVSCLSGG